MFGSLAASEEASLAFVGAAAGLARPGQACLVIDAGGRSTELVLGAWDRMGGGGVRGRWEAGGRGLGGGGGGEGGGVARGRGAKNHLSAVGPVC